MKINKVKDLAKKKGVQPGQLSKRDLIKEIQLAEGNFDCFGTADLYCAQINCLWREDCLKKNF